MHFSIVLLAHWLGDFVLQFRWMGENKHHSGYAMFAHIFVYTVTMVSVMPFDDALITGALHFVIDNVTSKMSAHFYKRNNLHLFWSVIGLDQILHVICLYVVTYNYIL